MARAQSDGLAVCHATGAGGYTQIAVDAAGLAEHATHAEDIVPAPEGGCPAGVEPEQTAAPLPTLTATPVPTETSGPGDAVPTPSASPAATATPVEIVEDPAPTATPAPGATAAPGSPPGLSATAPAFGTVTAPLARTGAETGLVGVTGLALLLCGAGLRLRLRGNAPGGPVFGP